MQGVSGLRTSGFRPKHERSRLGHTPPKPSGRILDHMPVRFPQRVVYRQFPHKLGRFRAHPSESAREVTDPQRRDRPHPCVRCRPPEANTPALDERSVLVV